jgi:hypothetical protein
LLVSNKSINIEDIMDKPFPPTPYKVVTLTIEEDGTQTFLKTDSADIFLEQGEVVTRRASHVEPYNFWLRLMFTVLRFIFPDTGRVAAWTRTWACRWRVNTSPVGGPILTWADVWGMDSGYGSLDRVACFAVRQNAIAAEVKFLNNYFAESRRAVSQTAQE